MGVDTVDVGVLPSGGISYPHRDPRGHDGAVVSASHNPAEDNGIKLLSARGTKLPDEVEREMEDRLASGGEVKVGPRSDTSGEPDGYRRVSRSPRERIPVQPERGQVAARLRQRRRLQGWRRAVGTSQCRRAGVPRRADGTNINDGCGATSPEFIAEHGAGRIGLAFDGDADRLIAVDEVGLSPTAM